MTDKQIKLVETILYHGSDENLEKVEQYIKDLLAFRKLQKK